MPQLGTQTITTALTSEVVATITGLTDKTRLTLELVFSYGSGGTDADIDVQTSLDAGSTWITIARFNVTTATARKQMTCLASTSIASAVDISAAPSDDTARAGILGDRIRMIVTSTGTYAGNTSATVNYYAT